MASAYGRRASIRCSARRSRAAATISIARVILRMFLNDAMRPRMSFRVAMRLGRRGLLLGGLLHLLVGLDGLAPLLRALLAEDAVGLALLDRVALGVEVGPEVVDRLGDRVAQLGLDRVVPLAVGDLRHQIGL